jgi:hypothetical protein
MPSVCQDNGAFMDGPMKEVSNQNKLKHFSQTKKLAKLVFAKRFNNMQYSASNLVCMELDFSALCHGDYGVVGRVVVCGCVSSSVFFQKSYQKRRNSTHTKPY